MHLVEEVHEARHILAWRNARGQRGPLGGRKAAEARREVERAHAQYARNRARGRTPRIEPAGRAARELDDRQAAQHRSRVGPRECKRSKLLKAGFQAAHKRGSGLGATLLLL
jgi:hypothetical protein